MILTTASGDFAIPAAVAELLPQTPPIPDPASPEYNRLRGEFEHWLGMSVENAVAFDRLRRWHLVQEELAAAAKAGGRPFVVTDDGLE